MFFYPRFHLILIRFLSLLGILGLNLFSIQTSMDIQFGEASQQPNKDVTQRLKKLMVGLQSKFGGPESAILSGIIFLKPRIAFQVGGQLW
uniref:Uncharacterized protein n=1 Tax=Lactuca sativa TaxID=4236 RepID=A0A9R1WNP6_LACSA|nr:hypothetical protein LSAT_V11C100007440 [Lactuca sativa]